MKTNTTTILKVKYLNTIVGYLNNIEDNNKISFRYDEEWLKNGFSISPFSLPLRNELFIPSTNHFNGLFGVFADSLPDSWGMLLIDRKLKKEGYDLNKINILDLLKMFSNNYKALSYEPSTNINEYINFVEDDLDRISKESLRIIEGENIDSLDEILKANGSSGGARPKININIENELWLVKFKTRYDYKNIARMEYDYMKCANNCGIRVPEYKLIKTKNNEYFASKRFDYNKLVLTAAAILESDYRSPSLDYNTLIKLSNVLSNGNKEEVEMMFRIMCFNVFAHNRDDHAKNFSFIYNEVKQMWEVSPVYDLTYSNTFYGEHTTSVDGNGYNPGEDDILRVAKKNKINNAKLIMEETKEKVNKELRNYLK